ncbi:MAG: DUF4258 domain-containing protein [Phycisphaerae bacterium]|nr:DUF4258 domain-containing protein [Phycisphaerae bacterium]
MNCKHVLFSGHAIRRMFQRGLSKDDVLAVTRKGEIIANYSDDIPYPSCLILGIVRNLPVHVVLALDEPRQTGIVVTAYVPDLKLWADDFKTRREK